jgi:hypothetical protein
MIKMFKIVNNTTLSDTNSTTPHLTMLKHKKSKSTSKNVLKNKKIYFPAIYLPTIFIKIKNREAKNLI